VCDGKRELRFSSVLVPERAIAAIRDTVLGVRKSDFGDRVPRDSFDASTPLYDLHDFAHLTTATLCPRLYGNKYFDCLFHLPNHFRRLIQSPGLRTEYAVPRSDGLIFSELLTTLFRQLSDEGLSNAELVARLAQEVCAYLMNDRALLQPSTGRRVTAGNPLTVEELAVLSQNKAYELPASEVEQQLFTRSGVDELDRLGGLSVPETVKQIARTAREWRYYERRNVLKHRAQKAAYEMYAKMLLAEGHLSGDERRLTGVTLDHISYRDFWRGERANLFGAVGRTLGLQVRVCD